MNKIKIEEIKVRMAAVLLPQQMQFLDSVLKEVLDENRVDENRDFGGILRNPTLKLEINELTNNYNISDERYMVVLTKNDETGTFVVGSFKNIDTKKK